MLLEYYAATEIGIITACTSQQWLDRPGTVGKTPEGVQISVVDAHGHPVPTGEKGEILIQSGAAALVDYHSRPEAMQEPRRSDWVTLGDIGYMDADGFLWISDRKKDMVISGGVNMFPAELEAVALQILQTMSEAGVPNADAQGSIGIFAPRGTPPEVLTRLEQTLARVMSEPKTVDLLVQAGTSRDFLVGKEYAQRVVEERELFGRIIKEAGIVAQ